MTDKVSSTQNKGRLLLTLIELAIVVWAVYFDVFIPTLVILLLAIVSLLIRREKASSLGFRKNKRMLRMAFQVFLFTVVWTLVDFGLILPILNHLTGTTQNMGTFDNLKGNVGLLLFLICMSWTLAALGEEIAYRGFTQTRVRNLFNNDKTGIIAAVVISSILFGLAHREQGIIGVVVTFFDAMYFSFMRYRYKTLWASVLAHGFMNTIGIVTFFFTGPLYGLW